MAESSRASGVLELNKDADYFRVDLVAGRR